jgi:hypothetical protein
MAWHTDLAVATAGTTALQEERRRLLLVINDPTAHTLDLWMRFLNSVSAPVMGTSLLERKIRYVQGTDVPVDYAWLLLGSAALSITDTYADGQVSVAYNSGPLIAGGRGPYTVAVTAGSLPSWASLNSSTGVITGTPDAAATSNFTVEVTDANGVKRSVAVSITIVP